MPKLSKVPRTTSRIRISQLISHDKNYYCNSLGLIWLSVKRHFLAAPSVNTFVARVIYVLDTKQIARPQEGWVNEGRNQSSGCFWCFSRFFWKGRYCWWFRNLKVTTCWGNGSWNPIIDRAWDTSQFDKGCRFVPSTFSENKQSASDGTDRDLNIGETETRVWRLDSGTNLQLWWCYPLFAMKITLN